MLQYYIHGPLTNGTKTFKNDKMSRESPGNVVEPQILMKCLLICFPRAKISILGKTTSTEIRNKNLNSKIISKILIYAIPY